jgi:hypothetical protein
MIIRIECNNVEEKYMLFDLMQVANLDGVFARATMKGYLDEKENREVELIQLTVNEDTKYRECCKVLTFFLEYIQGMDTSKTVVMSEGA